MKYLSRYYNNHLSVAGILLFFPPPNVNAKNLGLDMKKVIFKSLKNISEGNLCLIFQFTVLKTNTQNEKKKKKIPGYFIQRSLFTD